MKTHQVPAARILSREETLRFFQIRISDSDSDSGSDSVLDSVVVLVSAAMLPRSHRIIPSPSSSSTSHLCYLVFGVCFLVAAWPLLAAFTFCFNCWFSGLLLK